LREDLLTQGGSGRRSFLKSLSAIPLFAVIGSRGIAGAMAAATKKSSNDTYAGLGVRPLINARGTWTYLSGSLELPEVRRAVEEASHHFVDMFELQQAASKRLAELSGAESGMVTSGSAGSIASATAACIAGTDPKLIWQLPDTTGLKNKVVMLGGRNPFDSAIRLVGAQLVIAATLDDLPSAIDSQTAMVYTTFRDDRLLTALETTRAKGVPILVDHAAGIPPYDNFTRYGKMGVDLCCFSGGKGMRGPQCSGVLLGRKDLIDAALANSSPWEGAVCRSMKVGKEEIIGMLAAIEYWSHADLTVLNREWQGRVQRIGRLVETVPGVTTSIAIPQGSNSYPTLTVKWDETVFGLTLAECAQQLREGEPRIEVLTNNNPSQVLARVSNDPNVPATRPSSWGHGDPHLQIVSVGLQPGEDLIVGNSLRRILKRSRKRST
jgi:seryl-tRNA(Sec) selenium transferase